MRCQPIARITRHIRPGNGPGDTGESGFIRPRRLGLPRGDQRRRGFLREERMGGAPSATRGSEGGTSESLFIGRDYAPKFFQRVNLWLGIGTIAFGRPDNSAPPEVRVLIMRVAVSKRPTLPGTRPRIASARRCSHPITSAPVRLSPVRTPPSARPRPTCVRNGRRTSPQRLCPGSRPNHCPAPARRSC